MTAHDIKAAPAPVEARQPLTARLAAQTDRALASLRHRDFRYLAVGSLALGFGQWFQMIGLGWLVLTVTGSPLQMAAVTALRGTVTVAASPLGGVLTDRFDRKAVAAWSTGLACVQALALSLLVLTDRLALWEVYAFAALEGFASGVYMPARQALVFNVVPRESLANAVAMNSISQNLSRITGPALAGAVIGLMGMGSAFLILGLFKIVAGLLTIPIRGVTAQRKASRSESPWASMAAGVRYSLKDATIVALLVVTVIPSLLILPYVQMLPFFADKVLHRGAGGFGLLATGVGWGSLLGLGALVWVGDVRRKGLLTFVTLFFYAVFVAAFSQSTVLELSMVFLVGAGIAFSVHMALVQTLFQLIVPDEFRGRVLALSSMGHGFQPLGSFPMAVAIEAWGPADAVSLFMVMAGMVTVLVAVFSPKLRAIRV